MNNKIWVAVVVIIIIVLVGWGIYALTESNMNPYQSATATSTDTGATTGGYTPTSAGGSTTVPTSSPTSTTSTNTSGGAVIQSAFFAQATSSALGTYLTDQKGRTLYVFTSDSANKSNCNNGCAVAWPAYGPGISGSGTANLPMLPAGVGIITRADGSAQFTWNNQPLYYYAQDKQAGDVKGQGVGGTWYVIKL